MKEWPGGVWEAHTKTTVRKDQRYRVMACSRAKGEQRDRRKPVEKEHLQQHLWLYGFPK